MRHSRATAHIAIVAFLVASLASGGTSAAIDPRWGDITGPVTATSLGIRIPKTADEIASLSPDDLARIEASAARQFPRVRELIDAGVLTPQRAVGYAQPRIPAGHGRLLSPLWNHMFQDARCVIEWQPYPFTGTYVWGWVQTLSNTNAWDYAIGSIYQNGTYKGGMGQYVYGTVAYGRSDSYWVAWWDHPVFLVQSTHYIKDGAGNYDWGPWNCSVNKTI